MRPHEQLMSYRESRGRSINVPPRQRDPQLYRSWGQRKVTATIAIQPGE
jgi:hypothetical protein